MESEKDDVVELNATIGKYCPRDGTKMIHKDSLTEDPELSGWECPVCLFCFYD